MNELRDVNIQKDGLRFRKNIFLNEQKETYEIRKTIRYKTVVSETLFGKVKGKNFADQSLIVNGQSMVLNYKQVIKNDTEMSVEIISVIGIKQAVVYVKEQIPIANIWIAAVDEKLNDGRFIVSRLDQTGDLCFGEKLQH